MSICCANCSLYLHYRSKYVLYKLCWFCFWTSNNMREFTGSSVHLKIDLLLSRCQRFCGKHFEIWWNGGRSSGRYPSILFMARSDFRCFLQWLPPPQPKQSCWLWGLSERWEFRDGAESEGCSWIWSGSTGEAGAARSGQQVWLCPLCRMSDSHQRRDRRAGEQKESAGFTLLWCW